jgi:hypothetical protein
METNINNENLIPKLKTPTISYVLSSIVIFLIVMMILIMNDVSLKPSSTSVNKSQQQIIGNTFIVLFFSLIVVGLSIMFLPSMSDFKKLFGQISNVTYVFIYTIFVILFYTLMSPDIINNYYYIINPPILLLGVLAFYNGFKEDYIDKFNVNYERIKMLIILFCLITLIITFYNINPGGSIQKYFGYSLLLTIIIAVFAFLYLIILITMGEDQNITSSTSNNLLNNFSSFGVYGSILFVIFLVIMTIIISTNKESFFANKEKSSSIILLLLFICIIWGIMLGVNLFNDTDNKQSYYINRFDIFKRGLLAVFSLVISGMIIYWLAYNIENLSGKSTIISFILNILLIIIILGLIYKTIIVKIPSGNSKKNAFFNLIFTSLLYIPCLASGGFDWIGQTVTGEYNSTDIGSLIMLVVAILLFITYLKTPSLFNYISTQGGNQLVNRPVYTDTQYNLGSYIDLNGGSDIYDYQFAISSWIFIHAMPPNTNSNYTKFTSLLNFGNKPNILYNSSKNELMITMQQKDLKNITKNKLIDFDDEGNRIVYLDHNLLLQKWNNIIINYNGGTLDIFINGELVKSSIEVVPFHTFDKFTIGENDGIKGGICNVIYFRKPLTSSNIYYIYNSVKNMTPPILNDSNETILVNNINTVTSSTKTVVNKNT